ncbi:hypothetical protein EON64_05485 [archaeon]|nr:MAG: hypothetical protein EON64_05485 [archaeon]
MSPQPESQSVDETEELISILKDDINDLSRYIEHKTPGSVMTEDSTMKDRQHFSYDGERSVTEESDGQSRDTNDPMNESNIMDEDNLDAPRGEQSARIFEIIDSLQQREFSGDEWENDDDVGYITISLNEEEFFDYENVRLSPSSVCLCIACCI